MAILLSHTFTICVRAGGYDERGLTDRTLDQVGGPSGVKRGAEESGRLDPATLRSRWEAAARGDAPESKPAASVIPEEERLAKPSDEIGRAPAGNELPPQSDRYHGGVRDGRRRSLTARRG